MKPSIALLVGVGLLITLTLCGCSGGVSTEAPAVDTASLPAANWYPLKVGSWWTYDVTHDTSLINPAPGQKFIAKYEGTVHVDRKVTQGGLSWFKLHFTALIGGYYALARHDATGLLGKDMPVAATKEYAIKKPIRVGTTWLGAETGITYKITSLTKTVTVPAGTFNNCMAIFCNDTPAGTKTTAYYAPGVGKVLVVTTKDAKPAFRMELKTYVLN